MKLKAFLVMAGISLLITGCSSIEPNDEGKSVNTKSATSPYVKLIYAKSSLVSLGGQGYTHVLLAATGYIEVENVAYSKSVIVHYLGSNGWVDIAATYASKGTGNNEIWKFTTGSIDYMPYWGSGSISFAIKYKVNGIEVWDNNGGNNYTVNGQGRGNPVVDAALGSAVLVQDNFYSYTNSTNTTVSGDLVLKNLAYSKTVQLVYTSNNWATSTTVNGTYYYAFNNGLEKWNYTFILPKTTTSIKYYLKYTVNGQTYYDNNFNTNYYAKIK